ncbi:MAG: RNA polymerase sigma factor [Planctomycetota bacterium]
MYEQFGDLLLRKAGRHGFLGQSAEEIVQDTISCFWERGFSTYQDLGEGSLARFLLVSVWYRSSERRKRDRKHNVGRSELRADAPPDPSSGPEETAIGNEHRSILEQAVDRLPEREKKAIGMRVGDGLTFVEIAKRLDVSLSVAFALYTRGVCNVKRFVKHRRPGGGGK